MAETKPAAERIRPAPAPTVSPEVDAAAAAILPGRDFSVDPAAVSGTRLAVAAAQIRRDGRTYQPGQPVRIDYRAYLELVPVAAIVVEPWDSLPEASDPAPAQA